VIAPVNADDRWSRTRRHEAVLYACYCMIRDNRELGTSEHLRVPLRLNIGAWPLDLSGKDAAFLYRITEDDGLLKLVPVEESDPALHWRSQGDAIAVNAYQALFDRGLADTIPSDLVRDVPSTNPDVVEHSVEVRERHDGRGYLIVTNGLGRIAQQEIARADCAHIEVAAWAPTHFFELVELVGTLGTHAHVSTTGEWTPGDLLQAPIAELGIGGFILADGAEVSMGVGPSVRLLLMVPLTPEDCDRVRGGGAADWLSKNEIDERRWEPFIEPA
jgi:hypothetical protein